MAGAELGEAFAFGGLEEPSCGDAEALGCAEGEAEAAGEVEGLASATSARAATSSARERIILFAYVPLPKDAQSVQAALRTGSPKRRPLAAAEDVRLKDR